MVCFLCEEMQPSLGCPDVGQERLAERCCRDSRLDQLINNQVFDHTKYFVSFGFSAVRRRDKIDLNSIRAYLSQRSASPLTQTITADAFGSHQQFGASFPFLLQFINKMMSRPIPGSPSKKNKSPSSHPLPYELNSQPSISPIKYLLQNNVQLNAGVGQRSQEEIELISSLVRECRIFGELGLGENAVNDVSRGALLIFCESPHIMALKENELYIFLEGQGFEYMQNSCENELSRKYKVYENEEYLMIRKILSNDFFLNLQESNGRYHSRIKYQLMVDQQTLLAKISEELFHKLFLPRFNERQKNLSCFLKTVSIFNGLPNSFFQEFSRFLEDEAAHPDQKVISRSQKAKFVYFIRKGEVELRRFTDKKPAGSPNYVITGKGYTTQHLREGDTFGMEGELGQGNDEEVVSLGECLLLRIEKRLLAIIITSFDFQFQQRSKIWSEVNLNSQITGQNHSSPEQQLLARNAERIRTGEKKVRDLKLRFFACKKTPLQNQISQKLSRESSKKDSDDMQVSQTLSPDEKRRMIKTTDGRFRSTNVSKFVNYFGGALQEGKIDPFRNHMTQSKHLSHKDPYLNNFEILVLETEEPKPSPLLRSSKAFEYIEHIENQKCSRPLSNGSERLSRSQKFIPKMQVRSKDGNYSGDRYDSDLIGVFLDKKIKNQIVRKAEKVLNLNKNLKSIESKNLKRLFTGREGKTINAMSELDKKNIATDIVERMSNLRDNPLLLQIQNERRKLERHLKQSERRAKPVTDSPRKYKPEEEYILIRNK